VTGMKIVGLGGSLREPFRSRAALEVALVRSLRGWAVPYVVPVPQAARVFADSGEVQDDAVDQQLRLLGEEVVRVAERFARDPSLHRQFECDDAADRVGQT